MQVCMILLATLCTLFPMLRREIEQWRSMQSSTLSPTLLNNVASAQSFTLYDVSPYSASSLNRCEETQCVVQLNRRVQQSVMLHTFHPKMFKKTNSDSHFRDEIHETTSKCTCKSHRRNQATETDEFATLTERTRDRRHKLMVKCKPPRTKEILIFKIKSI
jgi:hypothetical protein